MTCIYMELDHELYQERQERKSMQIERKSMQIAVLEVLAADVLGELLVANGGEHIAACALITLSHWVID